MTDPAGDTGRDVGRALVAVVAVLALVVAAALVPALTVPFATAPSQSDDPGNGGDPGDYDGDGGGIDSRPTEVNALAPGERTSVGGPVNFARADGGLNATHFVARTDRPSYWRTGAFGRYTGSGWRRVEDPTLYTGRLPRREGARVVQEITLRRPSEALPAAWRPTGVHFDGRDPTVLVTDRGALRVQDAVGPGTTYTVTSYVGQPSTEELREAGRDYPAEVRRYARTTAETPAKLTTFTDRITRDAENPYEAAVAIERWLESNKEYSLDASHDESRPVASQFVFEMDEGYCEYFATSMVVMLRSQGIPARYVVGYAPGTGVGEDTYRVRSVDAHAWVEVYFPDVGWVRFDPTPARERRAAERRLLAERGIVGDDRPLVEGSPGDTRAGEDWSGLDPDEVRSPPYQVTLDSSPVPGKEVTARVEKDGLPVAGVVVTFNGEPVGLTDRNGEVRAMVPYAEQLEVDARRNLDADGSVAGAAGVSGGSPSVAGTAGVSESSPSVAGATLPRAADWSATGLGASAASVRSTAGDPDGQAPDTYDLPTNVTFRVAGTPAEGRSFRLEPTIHGVPVRNATVTFDGEVVGRTDDEGHLLVDVPPDAPDPATVTVSRGEISATGRIDLRDLEVRVYPETVVPLPGQEATVVVTVGDERVENAEVWMDGRKVGTTDEHGEVETTLPTDGDATFRAEGPYQSAGTVVAGMWLIAGTMVALFLSPLGVLLTGSAIVVRRRTDGVDEVPAFVAEVLREAWGTVGAAALTAYGVVAKVWSLAVRGGLWLSRAAVSAAIVVGRALRSVAAWSVGAAGTLAGLLSDLAVRAGTWVADHSLSETVGALVSVGARGVAFAGRAARFGWLLVLGVLPFTTVALDDVVGRRETGTGATGGTGDDARPAESGPTLLSVAEAWRQFVRLLPLAGYRTMTPGEIQRAAVGRGFPDEPVGVIVEAFRDVEYGGHEEDHSLRERVTHALGLLLDGGEDGEDDTDDPPGGPGEGPDDPPAPTGGDD